MPYVDYVLNYDYIKKELCENKDKPKMNCHGKCYLKKEIKKTQEEEEDPVMPNFKNVTEDYYTPSETTINTALCCTGHSMNESQISPELLSGFSSGLLDPPQA